MKIAIYNPYLEVLGGGEKNICTIAEILSSEHKVDLFSHAKNITKEHLEERLDVDLSRVNIISLPKFQDKFSRKDKYLRFLSYRAYRLNYARDFQKDYDLLINLTNTRPFFCHAKTGILHVQFPFDSVSSFLKKEKYVLLRAIKTIYYNFELKRNLSSYQCIFVNSEFTRSWLKKLWGVDSVVFYPAFNINASSNGVKKKKHILNVGRFFVGRHNKKQDELVTVFKELYKNGLRDWQLHLVGGVVDNANDQEYLEDIKKASNGYPIFIHTNVSAEEVKRFYQESSIYWHATGYGESIEKNPEKMEHFGIVVAEAISYGCVPVVINRGGLSEIIRSNQEGFLWNDLNGLKEFTLRLCNQPLLMNEFSRKAKERSKMFSRERFKSNLFEIVNKAITCN